MLKIVSKRPGVRVPQLVDALSTSSKNIERWLARLKAQKKIVHKGSRRTGGYWMIP